MKLAVVFGASPAPGETALVAGAAALTPLGRAAAAGAWPLGLLRSGNWSSLVAPPVDGPPDDAPARSAAVTTEWETIAAVAGADVNDTPELSARARRWSTTPVPSAPMTAIADAAVAATPSRLLRRSTLGP